MKIVTIVGARPQFVKSSIVSQKLKEKNIDEIYIHTGQHYDENMSDIFFKELKIDKPKYNLHIGSGKHGEQTGKMIIEIEKVLLEEKPDGVLLYGDTNSTLAGAVVASKLHLPIFHVEGGTRMNDMKMPEEVNRIMVDHISDIIFAPTLTAMEELKREGLEKRSIFSGDVMLDRLLETVKTIEIKEKFQKKNNFYDEYYLLTLHRPHNVDEYKRLIKILEIVNSLDKKIIFLAHPRTKTRIQEFNINMSEYENIIYKNSVGYNEVLEYIKYSNGVISDSGGLPKEACFLGKKCLSIYETTAWKELENNGALYVVKELNFDEIQINLRNNDNNIEKIKKDFGNGEATKKIVREIYNFLEGRI